MGVKLRIDYFFIINNLKIYVKKFDIWSLIVLDYSMILLVLFLLEFCFYGLGFWKFNNVFFEDDEYKEMIREVVFKINNYFGN